jgi:cyclophilin family peptidyl-prolyl cis-trans isomerase
MIRQREILSVAVFGAISALVLFVFAQNQPVHAQAKYPVVALETTMGTIKVELFTDKAPVTTKNFLDYVKAGFYDGTIVHRIDFVIGMGGYTETLAGKQTRPPIENESKNGVKNSRGTISMARYADPNSATSQFFINLKDNAHLDPPAGGWGYAVFGRVVEGMDVVDKIAAVKVANKGAFSNVPVDTITVKSAKVVS